MKTITFKGTKCVVDTSKSYEYGNGTCILIKVAETGEPFCFATVNIPGAEIEKNEVIIKNYSENEGIFEVLKEANIVIDTGRKIKTGWVECPVAKMVI